jgi:hypothetical protein
MSTDTDPVAVPQAPEPGRRPRILPWVVGIAAAVLVVVVGLVVLDARGDGGGTPSASGQGTVTKLTIEAPQGRCLAPDATTLAQAQLAFSGPVVSVNDGVITLQPTTWYAGTHTTQVTVQQADAGSSNLIGAVEFRQGEDYYVAANNGAVMVCGFSGEKSSDLATLYQEAFAGDAT